MTNTLVPWYEITVQPAAMDVVCELLEKSPRVRAFNVLYSWCLIPHGVHTDRSVQTAIR